MSDNQLKINWKNILIGGMAALLIFAIITNANQANEIEQLNNRINNLNSEINMVRGNVSSIYDNVDEQLKKQASLLTSTEHTLGNLDADKHTIDVEIKVVPKTVTDNMEMSVKIGDTVADFRRSGNEFTAVIPVAMFLEYETRPMLYIETDTGTQTEVLEDIRIEYLYDRFLPTLHAYIPSHVDFTNGKVKINSHLEVSVKPTEYSGSVSFTKYELVTTVNDTEIEREDITAMIENGNYDGQFSKTITAGQGDKVVIYVQAIDSLGYIHKTVAYSWYKSEDGAVAEAMYDGDFIYDKEGNLLNNR
ncbi:MAG: hypothetical protein IJ325_06505 [Clostridia bacterium]|nr:hypothetical protein [Clostridia bacterium]